MHESPPNDRDPFAAASPSSAKWIIAQIGAREHYAAARAFQAQGKLERLYTDLWIHRGRSLLRRLNGPFRGLAGRNHFAIPPSQVTSFNAGGIRRMMLHRQTDTVEAAYTEFACTGEWFCKKVNHDLARRNVAGQHHAAFLINTGALETMQYLQSRGVTCIVDQIDPARVEEQVTIKECEKWPGWQKVPGRIPDAYYDRLSREWAAADGIVVNSAWSQQALVQQGVAAEKINVVPLAFETDGPRLKSIPKIKIGGPLQVLWLGQVILRKGIPYLFEAARELLGEKIEFIVAGKIGITQTGLAAAPANVRMIGQVARLQAAEYYRAADLFVLPTMSDGFAITQLEAMSFGLPVIATPRCGDVVTDGADGVIIPPGDSHALAEAIRSLHRDRDRLAAMSRAAVDKAGQFTLARFAAGLESAFANSRRQKARS